MKLSIKAGTTSKLIDVFIQDSSSTVGAGLGSLTNASSGLTWYYYREAAGASVQVTTIDTMTLGTWVTRGFIVIDNTNMPGCYQLGVPDAALAAGAKSVIMMLKGATNMAPLAIEIELTAWDNQDSVRGGITALPNANAEAAGGLYTRGTGAGQVNQDANGRLDANVKTWIGGAIPAVNVTGVPLIDLKYTLGTISPAAAGSVAIDWAQVSNKTSTVGLTNTTVGTATALTTNNDKTGYALTAGERNSVADAMLDRDMSTGVDSGSTTVRTVRQALRFLRNKWAIAAGTLTVYKEDDSTSSWTSAVTTDGTAQPIVTNDPAGP